MSFSIVKFTDSVWKPIKPKDFPFYQTNWDPFNQKEIWEKIKNNPDFWNNLQAVVEFNKIALESWAFNADKYQKWKKFFEEDMSLQAFFISWMESLNELWRCFNACWIAETQDIPNFWDFFDGYWEWGKRTFYSNLVFTIYWLKKLIDEYVGQDFEPDRYLYDFDKFPAHRQSIKLKLKSHQRLFGSAGADFNSADFHCWSISFNWNLDQWETIIKINDFPYHFWGKSLWFSEFLDKENPFSDKEKLNFLFPLWYRWWVFPIINLKEFQVKLKNGTVKTYRFNRTWNIEKWVADKTTKLLWS